MSTKAVNKKNQDRPHQEHVNKDDPKKDFQGVSNNPSEDQRFNQCTIVCTYYFLEGVTLSTICPPEYYHE